MEALSPDQWELVQKLIILHRDQVSIWTIKQEMEVKMAIQKSIDEITDQLRSGVIGNRKP